MLVIEDLRQDILNLISLYEKERVRGDNLASQLSVQEGKITKYKQQISDLTKQVERLKLENALSGKADKAETRQTIDKLVREIDKCIHLISD